MQIRFPKEKETSDAAGFLKKRVSVLSPLTQFVHSGNQ